MIIYTVSGRSGEEKVKDGKGGERGVRTPGAFRFGCVKDVGGRGMGG